MDWKEMISNVMYVVITAILPIVGYYLKAYLQSKIDSAVATIENEKTATLIRNAVNAIEISVDSVSQIYVSTLKSEGKFDAEAHAKAKAYAITKAKLLIAENSKKAITEAYGDFDAYLDDKIEAYLYNGK